MVFERVPIECHSVARPVRSGCISISDLEGMTYEGFQSETVGLQERRIRYGGQQVHVQVVDPVARHGQIERFGQMRHSHPSRDAADVR